MDKILELIFIIVNVVLDCKGDNIVVIRVLEVFYLVDYFVIIIGYFNV